MLTCLSASRFAIPFALLAITVSSPSVQADDLPAPDYGRDIRPILSNTCFQCHGADDEDRAADLRLDDRAAAIKHGAFVPGKADESELLARITSDDEFVRMPPPESNKSLTSEQIELLRRWIDSGAEYGEHWAFQPVTRPPVPNGNAKPPATGPIDAFVLRRLEAEGLTLSPEADRATLIRRLSQDLLGLLPTPEETERFVNDTDPLAYSKLVDRLLADPHYGERWGRHWLDRARYADSHGYTIDGARVMWPYRDWVIAAFNDDMPFDRFTIEQLAGDLLPDATLSQRVATAFHRNTMINQEGGVKPDQYRHEALVDRVNTTGAVWMGLTVGCAQCHTHKFDPLTHVDYHRLYAFFNDAADANNRGPTVPVREGQLFGWTEDDDRAVARLAELTKRRERLEKQVKTPELMGVDWKWVPADIKNAATGSGAELFRKPDGSLLIGKGTAANESYTVDLRPSGEAVTDRPITAIRLRVLTDPTLPKNGPGNAGNGNFVLTAFEVTWNGKPRSIRTVWADHSQKDYPITATIDGKRNTGWAINTNSAQAATGKRMNAPHEAIYLLDQPLKPGDDPIRVTLRHDRNENYQVGRFAIDFSTEAPTQQSKQADAARELASVRAEIRDLEASLPGPFKPVDQMVMQARANPPETFRLDRGDFLSPDRELGPLTPGVPAVFAGEQTADPSQNRLDLARWLVDETNPLTARVAINRLWAGHFGQGIVITENDFGYQGDYPTHPDLLDWLAAEFMHRDWSRKAMHREIVHSATYRQSSGVTPERLRRDPLNRLLARQSRFRIEAEIVRDQALTASGLLSERIGGPSVYPPQPAGIYAFTQNRKNWPTSTGPQRYRRTMYTMFYRSAPYPLLTTFDAPDFSVSCTRRVRSNTPLQSLTLANDPVFQELAAGLALRTVTDSDATTDRDRLTRMMRLALTREPTDRERDILLGFFERTRDRFAADPKRAADAFPLELPKDRTVPLPDLSAWTQVARVLLNTDEFLTRN